MPDSWRNILERAAENLSIELDQESRLRQQSAGWPAPRRVTPPPFALAYPLERERAGRPEDLPVRRPQRDQKQASSRSSGARAGKAAQSQKKSAWGQFAPAAISVAIVALTIYAIYNLLH